MQRVGSALLFLLFVSAAWAQSTTIPGTFNTAPAQASAVVAGPLLTPPSISFGQGVNGPLVVNGQTAVITTAPNVNAAGYVAATEQNVVYPGYVSGGGYVAMPAAVTVPVENAAPVTTAQQPTVPRHFDYIVAPTIDTATGMETPGGGVGDTSLGQIAATLRKGPPPTQRNFTNDDIARINGMTNNNYKMPAGTEQPQAPEQQQQQQAKPPRSSINNAPLPPGAKPSPFSPHPVPQTPTSSTSAEADPN